MMCSDAGKTGHHGQHYFVIPGLGSSRHNGIAKTAALGTVLETLVPDISCRNVSATGVMQETDSCISGGIAGASLKFVG